MVIAYTFQRDRQYKKIPIFFLLGFLPPHYYYMTATDKLIIFDTTLRDGEQVINNPIGCIDLFTDPTFLVSWCHFKH